MRKFFKIVIRISCLPVLLIVNPFTIYIVKRVKVILISNLFGILYCKNFLKVKCLDYPTVIGGRYFNIEGAFALGKRNRLECYEKYMGKSFNPKLTIEDGVIIMDDCHIGCINEIHIGQNTLIASKVMIIDYSHGTNMQFDKIPTERDLYSKGKIVIGKNCWIGENVSILPGAEIGDNCIVGANSVVTKSFKDNNLSIAGNPARVISGDIKQQQ